MVSQWATSVVSFLRRLGLGSNQGSELLEFALVVPLLLVFVVGIIDFGSAYNLKQQLNNAAREGARYAANQSSNPLDAETGAAAQAVGNVVQNYLTNAGLTKCTFTAPGSPTLVYTYSGTPAGCSLVINRAYNVTNGTGLIFSTHVTLSYPYSWALSNIIGLLLPSSTLSLPSTVSSDAIMQNLN
jgi:Flp pilus assembly protein TadG